MRYETHPPRPDWQQLVEQSGLTWHTCRNEPYWAEGEHLTLTLQEAERLEDAAAELHQLCLAACEHIIQAGWLERLMLPSPALPVIEASWRRQDRHLYGRFDLAWDGTGEPKLLEYNADTPTSLLEAAVIQWQWLEQVFPADDQLNSIHEALIARWRDIDAATIHFASASEHAEDWQTAAYLAETAEQAGKQSVLLDISDVGYSAREEFTDLDELPIQCLFKLYPWEWMVEEPFFAAVPAHAGRFIEPAWKMMLANKAILPILWELNPHHPLLLPAACSRDGIRRHCHHWVEKPIFGREGAGIQIVRRGMPLHRSGQSGQPGPVVFQQQHPLFCQRQTHFVWGLWMVGDQCRGLSARGDHSPITGNTSRFVPHRIRG